MIDYEVVGQLEENSYIVYNDKFDDCILVDPGAEAEKIEAMCNKYGKNPKYILLTHGHFDHIGACKYFQDRGAKVYVHTDDAKRLEYDRMAVMFGFSVDWFKADHLLNDGDELEIIGNHIKVVHTPGHSKGSCIYIFDEEKCIFVGDTIFYHSYGRTDFPDGSALDMIHSFQKIYKLKGVDDYTLYSGHGISSNMSDEKRYNVINSQLGKYDE